MCFFILKICENLSYYHTFLFLFICIFHHHQKPDRYQILFLIFFNFFPYLIVLLQHFFAVNLRRRCHIIFKIFKVNGYLWGFYTQWSDNIIVISSNKIFKRIFLIIFFFFRNQYFDNISIIYLV